jgi:hypothetical protein
MNVKMLAAFILPYKFKVAPYWSATIVFSTFLQMSNVKATQVCSAPAGRQDIYKTMATPQRELETSIQPFKRPTDS